MRVVLNGLITLKPKTGVGHYVAELHAALGRVPGIDCSMYPGRLRWSPVFSPSSKPELDDQDGLKPGLGRSEPNPLGGRFKVGVKRLALAALPWHFAAYSRYVRAGIYHEPNFVPFESRLPTVVTVHDLSVVKFPQWHPAERVARHGKEFLPGLQRAATIITVSEAIRRELIDELGIPAEKICAVHNGIGTQFTPQTAEAIAAVRRAHALPGRFFLAVGTVEPRKNLGMLMRAFADLPADVRTRCPLVLAGPWGWRAEAERDFFDRHGAAAGIRRLGYVPAADLPALYCSARLLLYPSHYEGFGLPPLEMLACGGAVIASTADAVKEVVMEHGELLDPNDDTAWRAAMLAAATDDDYVARLRTGGRDHAAGFTWDRTARETAKVYQIADPRQIITNETALNSP